MAGTRSTMNSHGLHGSGTRSGSGRVSKGHQRPRPRSGQYIGSTIGQKQRMTLATRPLIEALGDISRTAFTTLTSQAPARDRDLAEEWKNAFTVPNRLFIKDMFRYMFGINRPEFGVDDKWYPVGLVGHGSFGAAGLFKHLHEQGRVNDVSQSPSRIRGY